MPKGRGGLVLASRNPPAGRRTTALTSRSVTGEPAGAPFWTTSSTEKNWLRNATSVGVAISPTTPAPSPPPDSLSPPGTMSCFSSNVSMEGMLLGAASLGRSNASGSGFPGSSLPSSSKKTTGKS